MVVLIEVNDKAVKETRTRVRAGTAQRKRRKASSRVMIRLYVPTATTNRARSGIARRWAGSSKATTPTQVSNPHRTRQMAQSVAL